MTPSRLRATVITERAAWIRQMVDRLRVLPLDTFPTFQSDPRNVAAAESYLRRALEALLDLGRHVLARGFGQAKPFSVSWLAIGIALSTFIMRFQIANSMKSAQIRSAM